MALPPAKTNITDTHTPSMGHTTTTLVSSHDRGASDWAAQESRDDHEPDVPPGPLPVITGMTPATVAASDPATTITVNGTNFVSGAVVRVDGVNQATTFVSATALTISYNPTAPDTVDFSVRNPDGQTTASIAFVVT